VGAPEVLMEELVRPSAQGGVCPGPSLGQSSLRTELLTAAARLDDSERSVPVFLLAGERYALIPIGGICELVQPDHARLAIAPTYSAPLRTANRSKASRTEALLTSADRNTCESWAGFQGHRCDRRADNDGQVDLLDKDELPSKNDGH
jgi:hypothetical protein